MGGILLYHSKMKSGFSKYRITYTIVAVERLIGRGMDWRGGRGANTLIAGYGDTGISKFWKGNKTRPMCTNYRKWKNEATIDFNK